MTLQLVILLNLRDAEHLYEIPLNLHAQDFDDIVLEHFRIEAPEADMYRLEGTCIKSEKPFK